MARKTKIQENMEFFQYFMAGYKLAMETFERTLRAHGGAVPSAPVAVQNKQTLPFIGRSEEQEKKLEDELLARPSNYDSVEGLGSEGSF